MLTGPKTGAFPGACQHKSGANLGVETNVASLNVQKAVLNLVLKYMLVY